MMRRESWKASLIKVGRKLGSYQYSVHVVFSRSLQSHSFIVDDGLISDRFGLLPKQLARVTVIAPGESLFHKT